jgi:hypothetical protein
MPGALSSMHDDADVETLVDRARRAGPFPDLCLMSR